MILKILSIIILIIGFIATVRNHVISIKKKWYYNYFYIILSYSYTLLPLTYIILH